MTSLSLGGCMLGLQGEMIEITQKASNKTLLVDVVNLSDEMATIKNEAGKTFDVSFSSLTEASVAALKEAFGEAAGEGFTEANEAFGQPLLSENSSLWNEDAEAVAKRLGLKLESSVELSSSYRRYTAVDYLFAGAHPYCICLLYTSPSPRDRG